MLFIRGTKGQNESNALRPVYVNTLQMPVYNFDAVAL